MERDVAGFLKFKNGSSEDGIDWHCVCLLEQLVGVFGFMM